MAEHTAVRTVRTTRNGKRIATVTVTFPDGTTQTAGGKRAERAAAVIVAQHPTHVAEGEPEGIYGLRADLSAAQAEAHRLLTRTEMRTRSTVIPVVPWVVAIAVPVTDA